jgi:hypothetical protein
LSTPAIFDFFNFFEDNKTTIFPLHNLLNNNNSSFNTNELLRISTNTNLNNSFNTNIDTFFLEESFNTNQFTPIFQSFANDIQRHAINKNNFAELSEIFPEKTAQFEYFEYSGAEQDQSVYEVLSTPETKIFYPEPFIASPSFVHEDL